MSESSEVVAVAAETIEDVGQETEEEAASQMRQLPLEITVLTPNGIKIQVSNVGINEPTSYIRQILQEFQETAPFTNYDFEMDGNVINDYIEIGRVAPTDEESSTLTLRMKPAHYDIKKSRMQLKRVRDLIAYPPTAKGAVSDQTEPETDQPIVAKKDDPVTSAASMRAKLPKAEEIFAPATLENFFARTMLKSSTAIDTPVTAVKLPSDCVKSLSASGWNPPPPSRRSQGDLFYIEAVTEEAVFHITCSPAGFYVNKSTRYSFDPTPTVNAHFSHELFVTLLGASASLRAAWAASTSTPKVIQKGLDISTGALDVVSALYAQGREDQIFLKPQWTVPPVGNSVRNESVLKGLKHTFDLSRLHDDLGDQFGAEDPGAPREW